MGKTNKGQRTKGNTRPSSSVQSALLLNASGKSFGGFVGFDSLEKDPVYVPVTGQPDESGVDSDFRMVMRRMIKRDALTRLKAVQEFGDYCSSKDVDTVKSILPFWPRLFNKLALDCDRRIREATHRANGKLAGKVRRDYAPYLRNVLGVWLLGQCDAHSPSASAARSAFSETFPPDKRSKALLFCKTEIFSYFKENLYDPSKFLNDVNVTSPEEAHSKQVFVLSSTLLAIRLLFSEIRKEEIGTLQEDLGKIVSEAKFWSYMKHKEAQVRCAWYSLLSCLCAMRVEVFLEATKGRSSQVMVACLAEKDPGAVAAAWESALHVLCHFGVREQRDFEHSILPQLWCFLREGGRGHASTLYPCLLPMLSKFPREVLETSHFQLKFLDTLIKSLFLENVKNSRMECDAILQAFFECFTYFCLNLESEREVLLEKVLLQQVLPLVESSIYDEQCSHLIASKLYPQLGMLLCKMARVKEGPCLEAFASASTKFWTELYAIATKFDTRKKTVPPSRQLIFLICGLFDPDTKLTQRQSVRFEETASEDGATSKVASEDDAVSKVSSEDTVPNVALEDNSVSKVTSEDNVSDIDSEGDSISNVSSENKVSKVALEDTVSEFNAENSVSEVASKDTVTPKLMEPNSPSRGCLMKMLTFLYGRLCEEFEIPLLKILKELLASTLSMEVFRELLTMVMKSDALEFLEGVISGWSIRGRKCVECIVDVVFLVCGCISEEEGSKVLRGCCGKKDIQFLGKILDRARTQRDEEPFRSWLRSSEWMDILLDDLRNIFSSLSEGNIECGQVEELRKTLDLCLTDTVLREIITTGDRDEQLVRCIEEGLRDLPEDTCTKYSEVLLFPLYEVVCTLLQNVKFRQVSNDIVTLLFCKNLDLGKNHQWEDFVDAAWTIWDAAKSNVGMAGEGVILQIAHEFHSQLLRQTPSEELLLYVPDAIRRLLLSSETGVEDRVLEALMPSAEEWDEVWEGLSWSTLPCHLENKIFRPFVSEQDAAVPEDRIRRMISVSGVCASLLVGKSEKQAGGKPHFSGFLLDQLSRLLRSLCFCSGHGYVTEDILSAPQHGDLRDGCSVVLPLLSEEQMAELLRLVVERATALRSGWVATLSVTLELARDLGMDLGGAVREMLELARESSGEASKIVAQLLLRHLPPESKAAEFREMHSRFEMADPASKESLDLVGDLCCILQDPDVLNSDLGSDVAGSIVAALPRMDSVNNFPHFVLHSTSVLRRAVDRTGGIPEECWRLLERVFERMLRPLVDQHLDCGHLYDLHCLFCLGLVLFENASTEKNYAPFPRDSRPTVNSSMYERFSLLFYQLSCRGLQYPPLFRAVDPALAALQEAMGAIPIERIFRWAVEEGHLSSFLEAVSSPRPRIQYAAHSLVMQFIPLLATKAAVGEDEEGTFPAELTGLLDFVGSVGDLVTGLLEAFRIGDVCVFVPRSDAYQLAVGLLLGWLEIFAFVGSSPAQLRPGRIGCLAERKLLPALFSDVFRLLPENPAACVEETGGGCLSSLFLADAAPRFDGPPSSARLQALACLVYATALRKTPASVRTWFNNLDKQSADIVAQFTRRYVSGILISEELRPVSAGEARLEGMSVRARPGQREVSASYRVDDCDMELCVRLPPDFPLAPVAAERRGNVAVAQQEWRTWLMQLTTVLNYQDGSILDGIRLWKRNLDKKFEGVEECMICYYILHNSTLKLPKLSCHTCRKKFHSACLYKWFHTSNNSTCPLCRNEFII